MFVVVLELWCVYSLGHAWQLGCIGEHEHIDVLSSSGVPPLPRELVSHSRTLGGSGVVINYLFISQAVTLVQQMYHTRLGLNRFPEYPYCSNK